ncbi:unnamed protein product [Rotaria sp. Silwood2]|nr:unnamed protein product [Rotaria sp. Silwood2]CAF4549689.1 unnamed protein product [Rotaria sp. Silwood2]
MGTLSDVETKRKILYADCYNILSSYLDFNYSHTTDSFDKATLLQYTRELEKKFLNDMKLLEIIVPLRDLIRAGKTADFHYMGYKSNDSIYFNTLKFNTKNPYAKLILDQMIDFAGLSKGAEILTTSEPKNKKKEE